MILKNKSEFLKSNTCQVCNATGYKETSHGVEACTCLKTWQKTYLLGQKCLKAGLTLTDIDYTIDSYYGNPSLPIAINSFVSNFINNEYIEVYKKHTPSMNIFFTGVVNTQKSTVSKYIALALIKKGYNVKYLLMDKLIKTLLETESHTPEIKDNAIEIINSLKDMDLLILDESFDSKRITLYKSSYQIPFLTSFLKERLEVIKKSTIFISNKRPEDIEQEGFSEALESLVIRESLVLEFKDNLDKKHAMKTSDFMDIF